MRNQLEEILLDFNLNKARIISYYQPGKTSDLLIKVRTNENEIFEFLFSDVLLFLHYRDDISKFYINHSRTTLFISTVENLYETPFHKISNSIQENLFQFYNYEKNLSIEIISKNFILTSRK